ncbi:MAG TPA: SpoIIE family protein phosphatase [Vicinamibacterales bacterium]|nr:SpoIIE family protein phosphatase [Vicinamibacterales bacterium]
MSLRLRLIVAFFLLSVVPLAAVTLYAYTSNARALRDAAEREADLLTGELAQRMQLVTTHLTERVEHVMDLAELQQAVERATAEANAARAAQLQLPAVEAVVVSLDEQMARSIGDAAMLLNNVDFQGLARGRGRRPPPTRLAGQAVAPPDPPSAPPPATGATAVGPAEAADRLRIDLAPIRRELLREMVPDGRLDSLTPEQRQKLGQELNQRLLGIQEGFRMSARVLADQAAEASQRLEGTTATAPPPPAPPPPPRVTVPTPETPATPPVAVVRRTALSGNRIDVRVEQAGQVVREVNAEVNVPNLLATVFATTRRDRGEVPFAFGGDGQLYTPTAGDRVTIESLGEVVPTGGPAVVRMRDWVLVTAADQSGSGLTLGIARPVGDSLADLRRTAARNAGLGMLFIGLALAGIVPLSGRLTRSISVLGDGVRRIASGDYRARVPVTSRDEIGELAAAFNKMAEDVERHQRAAVGQERLRRELELGRQIQAEMLPHSPLRHGLTEIKGVSVPAREVGGDFFNYFLLPSGQIALLVGDVSGKGVGAALLMANIQASLRTRLALGQDLSALADEVDREIEAGSPGPVYATLFVAILDPATRQMRYVNAGHNPQYVIRPGRSLERMSSTGLPVGLFAGRGYVEQYVQLAPGDVLFFYTDGCVEAENEADDMLGAEGLEAMLEGAAAGTAEDILARVEAGVTAFRGSRDLFDDATMMAVKVG